MDFKCPEWLAAALHHPYDTSQSRDVRGLLAQTIPHVGAVCKPTPSEAEVHPSVQQLTALEHPDARGIGLGLRVSPPWKGEEGGATRGPWHLLEEDTGLRFLGQSRALAVGSSASLAELCLQLVGRGLCTGFGASGAVGQE